MILVIRKRLVDISIAYTAELDSNYLYFDLNGTSDIRIHFRTGNDNIIKELAIAKILNKFHPERFSIWDLNTHNSLKEALEAEGFTSGEIDAIFKTNGRKVNISNNKNISIL